MESGALASQSTPKRRSSAGAGRTGRTHLNQGSRVGNFLNGRDGEGRELRSTWPFPNTNTNTVFQDHLCGSAAMNTIAQEILRSLQGRSAMMSQRPRTAAALSLLLNDTRLDQAQPPYTEPLGPGSYAIEKGSPPMGTLRPGSPLRGTAPARDPLREHRAFLSPQRPPPTNPTTAAHHLGSYLGIEFQPSPSKSVEWYRGSNRRTDASDYRYGCRYTEVGKKLPTDVDTNPSVNCSGKPLHTAAGGLQARAATVPFMSKQPRCLALPRDRSNDLRLAPQRSDEDPKALGPGSYATNVRPGTAKRSACSGASAGCVGTCQSRPWSGRGSCTAGLKTSISHGINRAHKYGPFSSATDSSLVHS